MLTWQGCESEVCY